MVKIEKRKIVLKYAVHRDGRTIKKIELYRWKLKRADIWATIGVLHSVLAGITDPGRKIVEIIEEDND